MRTTITIADDVHREMERLRATEGLGPSAALNALARRGMAARVEGRTRYVHRSVPLGLRVDVHDVADVLDLIESAE